MNDETWVALKWAWALQPIWKATAVIMPLVGVAVFTHGWVIWRRRQTVSWHIRALLLTALTVSAITLVEIGASAYYYFYCAALYAGRQSQWQFTEKPLADMNLCYACKVFGIGVVATASCLALALLLPKERRK